MNEPSSNELTRVAPPDTGHNLPLPETVDSRQAVEGHLTSRDDADFSLSPPRSSGARPGFPIVPGYEILEEIGRGGMGVVYGRARADSIASSR